MRMGMVQSVPGARAWPGWEPRARHAEGHSPSAGHGHVAPANLLCPGSRASKCRVPQPRCAGSNGTLPHPCMSPRPPWAVPGHPEPSRPPWAILLLPIERSLQKGTRGWFPLGEHNHEGLLPSPGGSRGMATRHGQGRRTEQPGWAPDCARLGDRASGPCSACQPPGRQLWPLLPKNPVLQRSCKEYREKENDLLIPPVLYYSRKPPDLCFHPTGQ